MNSRLWKQKIEKYEIQKIGCDTGQKADENWMSWHDSYMREMTYKASQLGQHDTECHQ